MSSRAALSWTAVTTCIAAAFAAGTWWGGRGVERESADATIEFAPPAPRSQVPAAVASDMDPAVESAAAEAPVAVPVATPPTPAVAPAVEQDPQVELQRAAAASYAGTEVIPAAPAQPGPAGEQASMQGLEPASPVPSGPDPWPTPSGAAEQLAIQSEAAQ